MENRYQTLFKNERKGLYDRVAQSLDLLSKSEASAENIAEKLGAISRQSVSGDNFLNGELEILPLRQLLAEMVGQYVPAEDQASPILNVQTDKSVRINAKRLKLALDELLDNAYLNAGEDRKVHVSCVETDAAIEIAVSDYGNGMGIEEKALALFPFYSTQKGHIGLGLAWVSALLRSMGCVLTLYSEEGKGCVAVIRIPLGGS
jgi:signal transduction histidine kinase